MKTMKRVISNEHVRVNMSKEPLVNEEQITNRKSSFQEKRSKMKAQMHLNHLQRKAKRAALQKKEKKNIVTLSLNRNDFFTNKDYVTERVKRGLAAEYAFNECFDHWLHDFERALYQASKQASRKSD